MLKNSKFLSNTLVGHISRHKQLLSRAMSSTNNDKFQLPKRYQDSTESVW